MVFTGRINKWMNNVVVGRIDPRAANFCGAVANLSGQNFCPPFLKYERVLMPGDPLAADLVETVSWHWHRHLPGGGLRSSVEALQALSDAHKKFAQLFRGPRDTDGLATG